MNLNYLPEAHSQTSNRAFEAAFPIFPVCVPITDVSNFNIGSRGSNSGPDC